MKRFLLIVCVLTLTSAAPGQPLRNGMATARSSSGQFVIFAPQASDPLASSPVLAARTNFIALTPALLAVSCERLKDRLWRTLGVSGQWQGEICLDLHRARGLNERITVLTQRGRAGWEYRIGLPDLLDRDRLARVLVQVMLMEIANRGAGAHPAEVPAWLAEGLSRQLRTSSETELLIGPPTWNLGGVVVDPVIQNIVLNSPNSASSLEPIRREFHTRTPLTFQQLSWPSDQAANDEGDLYGCSAQFFVDQLLRLRNGAASLRTMLADLPRCYNWQTAFLQAFHGEFQSPLDVEKWWALQLTRFAGHGPMQTWTFTESCRKLDEIIRPTVDVRMNSGDLPLRANTSLQTIIREWDQPREIRMLQQKLRQLDLLRTQAAAELVGLIDDYHRVIQNYLQIQLPAGAYQADISRPSRPSARVTDQVIQELNALDARRASLETPASPPATEANASH